MSMYQIDIAFRAAATISLSVLASAQSPLFDIVGEAAGNRFAYSVAGVGDVDGDSIPDCAAGAPYSDVNGTSSGSVRVFSGTTGLEIYEFNGDSPNDLFGHSVAGGDVNGDGRSDIIVGAYGDDLGGSDSGTVFVYSGLDGSELFSYTGSSAGDNLGFSVGFVPDVDNDGFGEVLTGAWLGDTSNTNDGEVCLIDGDTGNLIHAWSGENAYDFFGYAVSGLEDLNGDGFGDVLVGAPGNGTNGPGAGAAYVYSGAGGELLLTLRGDAAGDGFGSSVADAGDQDADTNTDVIIGAPGSDLGMANAGLARVHSGSSGAVIHSFMGSNLGDSLGYAVTGGFDVTKDGVPDLFAGASAADPNGTNSGLVNAYSGLDGSLIATLEGDSKGGRYGASLACAGDSNLDGFGDLLVGAWGEGAGIGPFTGELHGISFVEPPVYTENFCRSLANSSGSSAVISSTGSTSVALNQFTLTCNDAVSSSPGLFFYGPNQIQIPFGDGFRCIGGSIYRTNTVMTDSLGAAEKQLDVTSPLTPGGTIVGDSVWKFQFWYRDTPAQAAGFNLSDGLSVTFLP